MRGQAGGASLLAFMNFKGGTGKTTLAIAIAEALAGIFGKRVLLVDSDFQSSASITLLGRATFNNLSTAGRTLDAAVIALADKTLNTSLSEYVVPARLAVVETAGRLSLLPASPNMPRRERVILSNFLRRGDLEKAYKGASAFIAKELHALAAGYDYLIIDCPPGITLFSEAALCACGGVVVPTLPNEISIQAIGHLREEVGRIAQGRSFDELHLGTLVSKIRHRGAASHYANQMSSIHGLLDRMPTSYMLLRPYLPFCRELEQAGSREGLTTPLKFTQQYETVARSIEEIAFAIMQRTAVPELARAAA